MDLWIRSQNRQLLTKVEEIKIDCCNGYYRILVNDSREVAKYETERRALEIINKIQDFISFAEFDDVPPGRYEEAQIDAIRYLSRNLSKVGKVFYMPEEEQIKEITEIDFLQMTDQDKARTLKEIGFGQTKIIRSQNG